MSSRASGVLAATLALGCGGTVAEAPAPARSCIANVPGADHHCGASKDADCCGSTEIPGGTFNRYNKAAYPATISGFALDVFDVTVGRFREFVDAYPGSRPKAGEGAHPRIAGSGWDSSWDSLLPATQAELVSQARCPPPTLHPQYATWTDAPGPHEYVPVSCVDWYVAFAFCAWDGGRLPTDAEWNFAAVGGGEQRTYPWGEQPPDATRAVLRYAPTPTPFVPVGSAAAGAGRWGQLDLAGSQLQWVLDDMLLGSFDGMAPQTPCNDCAVLRTDWWAIRIVRGVPFLLIGPTPDGVASELQDRRDGGASETDSAIGIRCARDAPL